MDKHLDILREVGTMSAGHGSIALSEILGRKIKIKVSSVNITPCKQIPKVKDSESPALAIISKIITGLKGQVCFILDDKNAFKLVDLSYRSEIDKKTGVLTEVGVSLVKEVGSIINASYVSVLGMMLKKLILLTPGTLASGTLDKVMGVIFSGQDKNDTNFVVETIFEESQAGIKGIFYLVISAKSADDIEKACKDLLKTIKSKKTISE